MLTGRRNAAPGPRTLEPGGPSGGAPAGGGSLELASCGEGMLGSEGSGGNSSSAMIYGSIIGVFAADLGRAGVPKNMRKGAEIQCFYIMDGVDQKVGAERCTC